MLKHLFNYLIFPGFLFSAILGGMVSWVDRKVTARLQWRVGPPWYQSFADLAKLSIKEVTIPVLAEKTLFLLAPLLGLSASILSVTFIWLANIVWPSISFRGDIIVVLYLLTIPSLAVILGGASSGNPLASLGVSREIKLLLAYELPFIISIFVPIITSNGLLRLQELITYQELNGPFISQFSGLLAMLVGLFCIHAKLGLVPFDMSEAETEIMGGVLIEYSGILLCIFKLTRLILLVALPLFVLTIFWGGFSVLKYLLVLTFLILLRNTNPRVRIDQAVRFFWGKMTALAIIAVLLAMKGM
jgi:NADH-quinone oxidoreductase subunit H